MQEVVNECEEAENTVDTELETFNDNAGELASEIEVILTVCDEHSEALSEELSTFTEEIIDSSLEFIDTRLDDLVEHTSKLTEEGLEEPLKVIFENSVEPDNQKFAQVAVDLDEKIVTVENVILKLVEEGMEMGGNITESMDKLLEKNSDLATANADIEYTIKQAETILV